MTTTKLMTAEELAQMTPDENRYDLIEGVLYTMPPAGGYHGAIGQRLSLAIGHHVATHRLGETFLAETGFVVARDPDTVLAPDISFVRSDRLLPWSEMRSFPPIVPDLAVEVMSPSDRRREVMTKVKAYLEAGVGALWLLDPDRRELTIYRPGQAPEVLTSDHTLDGGDILPGFQLPLAEIFPDEQ